MRKLFRHSPWATLCITLGFITCLNACGDSGGGVVGVDPKSSSATTQSSSSQRPVLDYSLARTRNTALHRGVNLGNYLESENQEGLWSGGHLIDSSWFPALKTAGFQSVRIPVRWSHHVNVNTGILDPVFLARVQTVVRQANAAGLVTIVDLHHFNELTGKDPDTIAIDNGNGTWSYVPDTLSLDSATSLFRSIWTQVSAGFASFPDDKLVLEVLNEPTLRITPAVHNALVADAVTIIRQANPGKTIMVGLTSMGKWEAAKDLRLPADNNMIVTVHFYEPVSFALQGEVYPVGKSWGTTTEKANITDRFAEMASRIQTYFPSTDGKGIPINIGEFGVNAKAELSQRIAWTSHVVKQCDLQGFSYNYWSFNSAGYHAATPYTTEWIPGMLDALVPN